MTTNAGLNAAGDPSIATDEDGEAALAFGVAKPEKSRRESLRSRAYEEIKRLIILNELAAGQYLNVSMLAERLGVGRTPVHESIMQLAHEGLLEVLPRKGVLVKPVSLREAMELSTVRLVNERYCATLAAERANVKHIETMREILEEADAAIERRDIEKALQLDLMFHRAIAEAGGNKTLAGILSNLHERSQRYWFISLSDPGHMRSVSRQHGRILRAIENHDPKTAASAMDEHISKAQEKIIPNV